MAYNVISGSILAAQIYSPMSGTVVGNILSGNLSTSDGAAIINVPRVSNATNNALLTNVGGDANTLTCESNLTFDGSALALTGELTASIGVSASFFEGDGSRLTGISGGGGGGISWDGDTLHGIATYKDGDEATVNSNFTFNGSVATLTGELSASIGVSASFFEGDGSRLSGIAGAALDVEQYGAPPLGTTISASADFALIKSGSTTGVGGAIYTLPAAAGGKKIYVKLSASVANVTVTAAAGDRIEGGTLQNQIYLESTGSAVILVAFNGSDWWIV